MLFPGSVDSVFAQSAPRVDAASPIKTTTRVVLLDVVVTDKSSKPVHGLKGHDFTVLEDGKAQQVKRLRRTRPDGATHSASRSGAASAQHVHELHLDPGAVSILLFDTLNTDRQDLTRARQQLRQYLSKLSSNDRIALFSLDSNLHLIHGLTDRPQALIETAQTPSTKPTSMYSNARAESMQNRMARMSCLASSRISAAYLISRLKKCVVAG